MRAWVTFAVAMALLSGCGGPGNVPETASLPQDRLELPEYDLARYRALIEDLRGKPVVVNVWGSWCPPCKDEAPDLSEVAREYEGRVQFLGVDILDARDPARAFIRRYDWPYPSIFDPTGAIRDGLGYLGQPVTLVYDSAGSLSWDHTGAVDPAELREHIERVL